MPEAPGGSPATTPADCGAGTITYQYDVANNLTSLTQGTVTVGVTYDAAGRVLTETLPNGILGTYTYDDDSHVASITYTKGATTIGALTYTYDAAGHRTTEGGSLARASLPAAVATSTYNADNQLTKWNNSAAIQPTYDANGNMLTDGTNSYVWNARGELTQIKSGATVIGSFGYDAIGRRTSKTLAGTTTGFAYNGDSFVQETSAGGTPTANLLTGGTDQTFSRTDAAGSRTLLTNAQGSTVGLADATGAVTTSYTYEPFGKATSTGATSTNTAQFTGRETDATLTFYRSRYLNPLFGRFISEDGAGFAGGSPNLYAYLGDDPVNATDPSGHILPILVACGVGAAFSIGIDWITHALGHRKYTLGDALGSAAVGCIGGLAGLGLTKLLETLATPITEGIYQVMTTKGLWYVGQSSNIAVRLAQHVASGKITQQAADEALRWAVGGGKTAREIAEQLRIFELGGKGNLANVVNPIGTLRAELLQTFQSLDEYLAWLDYMLK